VLWVFCRRCVSNTLFCLVLRGCDGIVWFFHTGWGGGSESVIFKIKFEKRITLRVSLGTQFPKGFLFSQEKLVHFPLRGVWIPSFYRNWNLLNKITYLVWNLTFHHFPKFRYKFMSNSWCGGWEMILYISRICFHSVTNMTLFVSLLYSKNITHKHLRHVANNSIQIYFV
jgi:hypothetical protein